MKANELMAGDWVRLVNDYGLQRDMMLCLNPLDICRVWEGNYVVEPIPITRGLLDKNDWKHHVFGQIEFWLSPDRRWVSHPPGPSNCPPLPVHALCKFRRPQTQFSSTPRAAWQPQPLLMPPSPCQRGAIPPLTTLSPPDGVGGPPSPAPPFPAPRPAHPRLLPRPGAGDLPEEPTQREDATAAVPAPLRAPA